MTVDQFNASARVLDKELEELGFATVKKMERLAKKNKRLVFGMTIRLDDSGQWKVWTTHGPVPPKKPRVTVALGMGIICLPGAK